MKKYVVAMLLSVTFLFGCDDKKSEAEVDPQGNFSVKAESLSFQNEADIREDLDKLNSIINVSNSKAGVLSQKLIAAGKAGDGTAIKNILQDSKNLLETTNASLLNLNFKSSEVQKVRISVYQGNVIAEQFYNLYLKDNKSDAEKQEIALLQRKMVVLQQAVGAELDQLNTQYKAH